MIYFTPGPSQLYPTVKAHLLQALEQQLFSISHRSKAYEAVHQKAVGGMKELLDVPEDYSILFHSSANEIWERMLQNCGQDLSFHFVNGAFSGKCFQFAEQLGVNCAKTEVELGEVFDFEKIEIPAAADLIHFTHNETSSGVMLDQAIVSKYQKTHPEALFTLDIVSSAPYVKVDWEFFDMAYFSVQKCFGLPAGLGVLVLSPAAKARAEAKANSGKSIGSYHSFKSQYSKIKNNQTPETPNVLNIYLLGQVVEDMLDKGVEKIRKEIDTKAALLYQMLKDHQGLSVAVKEVASRSQTVIVADTKTDSIELIQLLAAQGMVIGDGYGKMKGRQIRIANFPATSVEDVQRLIEKM